MVSRLRRGKIFNLAGWLVSVSVSVITSKAGKRKKARRVRAREKRKEKSRGSIAMTPARKYLLTLYSVT